MLKFKKIWKKIAIEGKKMKVNRKKIEEIVTKTWLNGCPMCGGRNWTLGESDLVTPIEVKMDRSLALGGKFMPLVPITCAKCGSTVFINALTVGALENLEGEKKNELD